MTKRSISAAVLARIAILTLALGLCSSTTFAQTTSTDTVRSRLPGDGAVKANPAPKPSMVNHPATEFHPSVKTTPPAPPPPPTTSTTTKKSN